MTDACGWNAIHAWVEAHRDSLPRTLAELSQYPMAYRRAIQAAVPTEVRIGFWREHLESFLTPDSRLSAEQRAFVRDALAELPEIFAAEREAGQARARVLEQRMPALFTREQAGRIFAHLGAPEPPEGLAPPA